MNLKKNYSLKVPITLFAITFLGLVFLIVIGIKLANTALVTFDSEGDTQITITKTQEYFVLLDTDGERIEIVVDYNDVVNYVVVKEGNNEAAYMSLILITSNTDATTPPITQIDFDKQVRTKGHLSFGKVTLEAGTYTIESENLINDDNLGNFALLGTDYVTQIGFFSFTAIATFTFALLGYKSYSTHEKKPISKYQRKHIK